MSETGEDKPKLLFLAGFGDDNSQFAGLQNTRLAEIVDLQLLNLPGFGAPPLAGPTTLASLGFFVAGEARKIGVEYVVAHSLSSVIGSMAVGFPGSPLKAIVSLEGNLTAADAYYSGTAADHATPEEFRTAFLARLDARAETDPHAARYRDAVARADPKALWELGCDAKAFSEQTEPGNILQAIGHVHYLYNPDNLPAESIAWLEAHPIPRTVAPGASHAIAVDQPEVLSDFLLNLFGE
ncbi:alpha/beta fold hydrolase [Frigidibacter sp. ROC022]|uniref:alpha/beta fold hydrolase n=1 Tax=Frigidibacter sp. ROC022 TaxID=2971796 RepID=UPI00215A46A1|nr:alpha/beta hydrolase [Frigidibacter sp. ROC022]MCR8724934.1 alpha/beta hydrolase [Frigidibacter sp. ROC022]